LSDYGKDFVLKVGRLTKGGIDFEDLTKAALSGRFGGATDVLLRDLSGAALKDPEQFVRETSRIFGRGAIGIYEPIIRFVDLGLYSKESDSPILELIRQLGPPNGGHAEPSKALLHEHRVKDEQGNYAEDAN